MTGHKNRDQFGIPIPAKRFYYLNGIVPAVGAPCRFSRETRFARQIQTAASRNVT